jgi:WD40 repeat protein
MNDSGGAWQELLKGADVKKRLMLRANIYSHEGQVHCVKLYDDADSAVSFGQDAKIIVYDIPHRKIQYEIATSHHGAILCGDISPDLKYMLSGGLDGHLFLWDLQTREKLCTMGTIPKDKTRKHRATHEKILDNAKPWEVGKVPWPGGELHKDAVKCTAFVREAPTNRIISGGWDKNLLVWDLKSYASFTLLSGHRARYDSAQRVKKATCGDIKARASDRMQDGLNWRVVCTRITGCATSYETRYCCTVSEDKTVRWAYTSARPSASMCV